MSEAEKDARFLRLAGEHMHPPVVSARPQYHTLYDRYVALLAVARIAYEWRQPSHDGGMNAALKRLDDDFPDWRTWT